MNNLETLVLDIVKRESKIKHLSIGIWFRSQTQLVRSVAELGHRTLVLSDHFMKLYKLALLTNRRLANRTMFLESSSENLPLRDGDLDILILPSGLPAKPGATATLLSGAKLLKKNGLLVFPHPVREGSLFKGRLALSNRNIDSLGPVNSWDLTAWAMKSGLVDISQERTNGRLTPWVVTTARAPSKPWTFPQT